MSNCTSFFLMVPNWIWILMPPILPWYPKKQILRCYNILLKPSLSFPICLIYFFYLLEIHKIHNLSFGGRGKQQHLSERRQYGIIGPNPHLSSQLWIVQLGRSKHSPAPISPPCPAAIPVTHDPKIKRLSKKKYNSLIMLKGKIYINKRECYVLFWCFFRAPYGNYFIKKKRKSCSYFQKTPEIHITFNLLESRVENNSLMYIYIRTPWLFTFNRLHLSTNLYVIGYMQNIFN